MIPHASACVTVLLFMLALRPASVNAQMRGAGVAVGIERLLSVQRNTATFDITDSEGNTREFTAGGTEYGFQIPHLSVSYLSESGATVGAGLTLRGSSADTSFPGDSAGASIMRLGGSARVGYIFDVGKIALWPAVSVAYDSVTATVTAQESELSQTEFQFTVRPEFNLAVPMTSSTAAVMGLTLGFGRAEAPGADVDAAAVEMQWLSYGAHVGLLVHFAEPVSGGRAPAIEDTWNKPVSNTADDATRQRATSEGDKELGLDLSGDGFDLSLSTIPATDLEFAHIQMVLREGDERDCPLRILLDGRAADLENHQFNNSGLAADYSADISYGWLRRAANAGVVSVRTCQYGANLTARQQQRLRSYVNNIDAELPKKTSVAGEPPAGRGRPRRAHIEGEGWSMNLHPATEGEPSVAVVVEFAVEDARDCPLRLVVDETDLQLTAQQFTRDDGVARYSARMPIEAVERLAGATAIVVRTCQYTSALTGKSWSAIVDFAKTVVDDAGRP